MEVYAVFIIRVSQTGMAMSVTIRELPQELRNGWAGIAYLVKPGLKGLWVRVAPCILQEDTVSSDPA